MLPKKLGITEGSRVAVVGAPVGFERVLAPLPAGVRMLKQPRSDLDVVVFFVTRRAELARRLNTRRQDVNRVIDLAHATKIDTIAAALAALGMQLEISATPA